jgi:Tol biopolymer transport system component
MALSAGTRLGPYEILSALGAGGMGEVFRARDTRLDRDVAIKVLPDVVEHDPERLLRFEREAKVLAALSHQNIASVYGFEQVDGRHLLILEFVDGPTLADRIQRGALPVDEALEIAKQIAEALDAAHEKGIIHRDLKPANVKITPEGQVKVLDFGLAKALGDETSGSRIADSPTLTAQYTQPGMVLGTAAYMSPEQARGKPLDKRTDIWSFGCVLYECLSGARLFEGESSSDIIAKILERDPDFGAIPPRTPPRVRDLLKHTLEKSARRRLRDIGDAVIVLEASISSREWSTTGVHRAASAPRRTIRRIGVVAGLIALLAFAAYGGSRIAGSRAAPRGASLTAKFMKLTDAAGVENLPSLAPDGKTIVYVATDEGDLDIFARRVGGLNPINLTKDSPKDDSQPAFSPDGGRIAFRSERDGGGLFLMDATGESPRRLTDFGFNPAWSADGKSVVFAVEGIIQPFTRNTISAIWTIDVATGDKRKLFDGDGVQPSLSPHNRRIAYWCTWKLGGQRDIYTIPVSGGEPVAITDDPATDWCPIWSPDGKYIFFCSDRGGSMNLWRVAVDENTGKRLSGFEPLTAGVTELGHPSISSDGRRIAFTSAVSTANVEKLLFDPKSLTARGDPIAVSRGTGDLTCSSVSPDGRWIVCESRGDLQEDIFLLSADGGERRQLTNDRYKDRGPDWSPDGRRIAFYSDRNGKYEIWAINADGSNLTQLTQTTGSSTTAPKWNPDGKRLLFSAKADLVIFDPNKEWEQQTSQVSKITDKDVRKVNSASWSPDGTCIVTDMAHPNGSAILAIYSFESKKLEPLGIEGGSPAFLGDGRNLIYVKDDAIFTCDRAGKNAKKLLTVAPDRLGPRSPCVSHDGGTIYYTRKKAESDIWMIELE